MRSQAVLRGTGHGAVARRSAWSARRPRRAAVAPRTPALPCSLHPACRALATATLVSRAACRCSLLGGDAAVNSGATSVSSATCCAFGRNGRAGGVGRGGAGAVATHARYRRERRCRQASPRRPAPRRARTAATSFASRTWWSKPPLCAATRSCEGAAKQHEVRGLGSREVAFLRAPSRRRRAAGGPRRAAAGTPASVCANQTSCHACRLGSRKRGARFRRRRATLLRRRPAAIAPSSPWCRAPPAALRACWS